MRIMVPCRKKNLKEKSLFSFFFPLKYRERNTGCKLLCNTLIDGDWKTTREETINKTLSKDVCPTKFPENGSGPITGILYYWAGSGCIIYVDDKEKKL